MSERLTPRAEDERDRLLGLVGDLARFAVETGAASAEDVIRAVREELEEAEPPSADDPGLRWRFAFPEDGDDGKDD